MYETLNVTLDGHVATVELAGPSKGNAMVPAFWGEMKAAFAELDRNREVRVVILRGRGDHFTFGLDLKASMSALGPLLAGTNLAAQRSDLHDLIRDWQGAFTAVEQCRKPVIAAIDGWCIGGGINLIAACDIRMCSRQAMFSLREPAIAITPDVGALQRLPRIIGQGAARLMAFTADDFDADFALQVGLVDVLLDDRDQLDERVAKVASDIARNAPHAVQGAKRVLNYSADVPIQAGLDYVAAWNSAFLQSEDLAEAFAAFAERRPPEFQGK